MSIVSVPLAAVCLLMVYIYRPYFLLRKFKALSKLEGLDLEEAIGKLTSEELAEYLSYQTEKVARRALK